MSSVQPVPSAGGGPETTGRPLAAGVQQIRRLYLRGTSGTVGRARDFTRQALHDWGWLPARSEEAEAAAEDVLLVVSELVTNACLHAEGPEELRIACGPAALRIEVTDSGPGSPEPRVGRAPGRPGGHGIFIVQRLCQDWGVVNHSASDGKGRPGKTVWAELSAQHIPPAWPS